MSACRLNILFVCSKNQWRSPTAETIYRNDSRFNARSAGINSSARNRISESVLNWADLILAMENKHKKVILDRYRHLDVPAILVLDIPDELIMMIRESTEEILNSWNDR